MATLADIDAALYTALSACQHTGTPSANLPFALVARYAGPTDPKSIREVVGQYPCALLRWEQGATTRTVDVVEGIDDTGTERWSVLTALEEPRDIDDAIASTNANAPGALMLVERVMAVLNGLIIDGLWRDRRIRVTEYGVPELVTRGVVYVHATRFEARRELPQATPTVAQAGTAIDLDQIAGDVNLEGTADAAPNPMAQLEVF